MKALIRRCLRALGFALVHHDDDPLLEAMRQDHEHLRLLPVTDPRWDEKLATLASSAHLRRLLALHSIDFVIDAGANEGQFAAGLRAVRFAGKVVSFEPDTQAFARLQALAAADPQWEVFPVALGSTVAEQEFLTTTNSVFSSFRPASELGRKSFGPLMQVRSRTRLQTARLDDLAGQLTGGQPRRILLKTDTQGFDLEVLRGATSLLRQCQVVLIEATFKPIYEGAPLYPELVALLQGAGFETGGIFPVSYDQRNQSLLEADMFFVRRADA